MWATKTIRRPPFTKKKLVTFFMERLYSGPQQEILKCQLVDQLNRQSNQEEIDSTDI